MQFDQGKPIYRQIVDWMGEKIIKGDWAEDSRIPSVRDVAMLLQVNPNTAMRAYESLQNDGVIFNKRGIGYFVSRDACMKISQRNKVEFITDILPGIFNKMELLGITLDDIKVEFEKFKK